MVSAAGEPAIPAGADFDLPKYIRDHLPLRAVPTVPEIVLHMAGPKSALWRLAERDEDFGSPYWAHLWGGGLALARHVLDDPALVDGRRVIDLGAGSGLVGIAAAKAGAASVLAADVDPYAMAAIALNAEANAVSVRSVLADLTRSPPPVADIVLVGDLFYDEALAARVTGFLDTCLESGLEVIVGDPGRAYLPMSRLALIGRYPGADFSAFRREKGQENGVYRYIRA